GRRWCEQSDLASKRINVRSRAAGYTNVNWSYQSYEGIEAERLCDQPNCSQDVVCRHHPSRSDLRFRRCRESARLCPPMTQSGHSVGPMTPPVRYDCSRRFVVVATNL